MSKPLDALYAEYEQRNAVWLSLLSALNFTEWSLYRTPEPTWPAEVTEAWQVRSTALHAFYTARDGADGLLGSRGL
jgi:hypothetical protein